MARKDKRVDAYIAKAAPFAQPILVHIREVVHAACPEVEEEMKWGHPHFMYQGMLCGVAAFKQHCTFGFWKHELIFPKGPAAQEAAGQFGCVKSVKDLPARRVLAGYVKTAMKLNAEGVKAPRAARPKKPEIPMPADFKRALAGSKAARATFDGFSPSHRREYLEWITEAKTDATRQKRIATALEWLAEGKARNWKYEKC